MDIQDIEIKIKSIELKNFKGIKHLKTDLWPATSVCGDNATGKTTIFDAFTWLMFGKDSQDRKEFGIKTKGADGLVRPKQEHYVEAAMEVDGTDLILRREYKEKWQRRRGEEEETFAGHETLYYIRGVPVTQKDYQETIAQIVTEDVFKMVTNPLYFNSLPWQDRREVVMDIAGRVYYSEIIDSHPEFKDLGEQMETRKLEDIKSSAQATIKKIKQDLSDIPARIDELQQQMPEQVDVAQLQAQATDYKSRLEKVDKAISDKLSAYTEMQEKKEELTTKYWAAKREFEAHKEALKGKYTKEQQKYVSDFEERTMKVADKLRAVEGRIREAKEKKASLENHCERLEVELKEQGHRWTEKNEEKYSPTSVCPECGFDLSGGSEESFNIEKAKVLAVISNRGEWLSGTISESTHQITEIDKALKGLNKDLEWQTSTLDKLRKDQKAAGSYPPVLSDHDIEGLSDDRYKQLKYEIDKYGKNMEALSGVDDPDKVPEELKREKQELTDLIEQTNKKLNHNEVRDTLVGRVEQLMGKETDLSMELSAAEKVMFTIAAFEKARIEAMYDRIRAKFPYDGIEFLMYRQLINGGEEPSCDTLVEGVPWPDVNHGHKIKAGLSIVRTLADHYGVKGPVWVDNAEAVVTMTDPGQQIIAMYATPGKLMVKPWTDSVTKMSVKPMLG